MFQLSDAEGPSVVASFLFQDQMGIGTAEDGAYSLLILGEPRGNRFERTFTWYRPVGAEGKGAPRFFSWMDLDDDGEEEIFLEVFGAEARWWASLNRQGRTWTIGFQDSCGSPAVPGALDQGGQGGSR